MRWYGGLRTSCLLVTSIPGPKVGVGEGEIVKSGSVCKTPFVGFTKTVFS